MPLGFPDSSVGKESSAMLKTPVQFLGQKDPLGKEGIGYPLQKSWASLVTQLVKNLPGFDSWVGKTPWRRERLPTPVFCPGEFHGLYSPWGCKESHTTERLSLSFPAQFKSLNSSAFSLFYGPTLTSVPDHWKNHSFD